jgi:hypothetical protein
MIESSASSITSIEAEGILNLWVNPHFTALINAIKADLAIAQVKLARVITEQSASSLAKGELPAIAKEHAIVAGELGTVLRVLGSYGDRNSVDFLEVKLNIE